MTPKYDLTSHFAGKTPNVTAIYIRLVAALRQFGEVRESPRKRSIHLDHGIGFAGIATRQHYVRLSFRTDAIIESPRIDRIEQLTPSRYQHTLRLLEPEQVDAELLGWLRRAYDLAR